MSDWKATKLSDICTNISYGFTESANIEAVGPKFLRITDIVPDRINWETVPYCIADKQIIEKYKLQRGDIVIARTGATTGYNKIIKNIGFDAIFASYLIRYRIDKNRAYPQYIGHILQSTNWYDYIDAIAGGSAQPGANAKELGSFDILLPSLPEQKAISSVLSSLDDKIDLLHRQNKTLEAMAETLFRQWFVVEADDSWAEVDLEYVAERITDGAHQSPSTSDTGMPMASVKDMHQWGIDYYTCRKISEADYQKLVKDDCRPLKNDILIAKDGSYLKHIFVVPEDMDLVILSSIAIIRANGKYHPTLLSIFLKLDSTNKALQNIVTGAVIPRIVLKDFRKFPIILPPLAEQNKALLSIQPLIDKCYKNIKQIHSLEKLRDMLLPKLMSGEVGITL